MDADVEPILVECTEEQWRAMSEADTYLGPAQRCDRCPRIGESPFAGIARYSCKKCPSGWHGRAFLCRWCVQVDRERHEAEHHGRLMQLTEL